MSRRRCVIAIAAVILSACLALYAEAPEEGLVGVWVDEESVPKEIFVIAEVQGRYTVTLLPRHQYERQKSFTVAPDRGYLAFRDAEAKYVLLPRPERGFIELDLEYAGFPEPLTFVLTPLKDKRLVEGYLMLNESGVRLRKDPSVAAEIIRKMERGEVVKAMETAKEVVTIQGKSGHWTKVRDVSGTVGWIFGAFLAELN